VVFRGSTCAGCIIVGLVSTWQSFSAIGQVRGDERCVHWFGLTSLSPPLRFVSSFAGFLCIVALLTSGPLTVLLLPVLVFSLVTGRSRVRSPGGRFFFIIYLPRLLHRGFVPRVLRAIAVGCRIF